MTRAQAESLFPDVRWVWPGDVESVQALMEAAGWLGAEERVLSAERAGAGNMNLTLRVVTGARSVVLKQSRPWVEKYPSVAAPFERGEIEGRFYRRVASISAVAHRMPRLLGDDPANRALLIEDISPASDYADLYAHGEITIVDIDVLADYLRALHEGTRGPVEGAFENRAMRASLPWS